MKRFLALAACAMALASYALLTAQSARAQTAEAAKAASTLTEKSAQVDRLLSASIKESDPGAVILIIQNGQVLKSASYGLANVESKMPVTAQTPFEIGSMSKPFTAMAVMMLAERGKLGLDDPLTKFFPTLPAYAQKIAVRHLLNHTSGLVDVINPKWFRRGYQPTSQELVEMLAREQKVNFAAGENFEYNNTGYVLLALIVEKASGVRFSKFMRENIFKPLEMNRTLIYDETKPKIAGMAVSYSAEGGAFKRDEDLSDKFFFGAKGVISTAEDLAKWDHALETEKLVKAATLRRIFAPTRLNNGTMSAYGFGWYVSREGGLDVLEHGGGYLGYRSYLKRYPAEHTTLILLSNNGSLEYVPLTRKIGQIYLAERMTAPASVKVERAVLQSYVGKYEGDPTVMQDLIIEITLEDGELYITSPIKPKTKLLPQSPTDFAIAETASSLTFERDAQGNVSGMKLKTRRGIIDARKMQ